MRLFAGIDGGQSATRAVIGDETGAILGRGMHGPADEVAQSANSTRLRDALEGALHKALADAHLPSGSPIESLVAGISGYHGILRGEAPQFSAKQVRLLHDAPIAHAGAFDGNPGVLVIAGTGSVAYGIGNDGSEATVGGWGYLFGDEGSAFWIALQGIQRALRFEDTQKLDAPLVQDIKNHFATASAREMTRSYYANVLGRDRIATFAKTMLTRAEEGEDSCLKIARAAVNELVRLATTCAKTIANPSADVAFAGGLVEDDWLSQQLDAALQKTILHRARPKHDPAVGALLLAIRQGTS